MIGSTDIVGHKRARPFPLYSESCYEAESDFFSFHTIQMQKMSSFKVGPILNTAKDDKGSQIDVLNAAKNDKGP